MRIGMAVAAFLPASGYGGPVWNIVRLMRALEGAGVDSTVLTTTLAAPGRATLPPGQATVDGLAIERMPVRLVYHWSPWVRWLGPQVGVDLLHVFGLWNGLSYAAIHWANRAGVPWVWEPSGMMVLRGKKRLIKRLLTPYHRRLARSAAGIIWTAPQERDEAPEPFREVRHWLRPNPAPEVSEVVLPDRRDARKTLGLPAEGPVWGYLGRVAARKGIDSLLRIWRAAGGPGTLCVTGPVEDRELAATLRAAGPDVVLHPPVAPADRWALLRALDALVLIPDYGENFGLVVVEAIAAGTPALVSPAVGAGHWLAGHGAIVLDPVAERLAEIFRSGAAPSVPCSIPGVLELDAVGRTQAEIYRAALAPGA